MVRTDGRAYSHVITNFSRMGRLPHFFSYWAPPTRALRARLELRYKPDDFGKPKSIELHSFSNASISGYGQCSYVRMVNDQQKVHCSLVMAKSRVTPLKPVNVPRLELTAALVSTKISAFLGKELKYDCVPECFWTESKVVLGYISNEARRFHTFVANRVQGIRDHTSPDQWHYIDTKDNPADDASRAWGAGELIKSNRWWNGPNFLWIPQLEIAALEPQTSPEDPEVKKATVLATRSMEHSSLLERIAYFSNWYRTKGAIAICQLFIERMKLRAKKPSDPPQETTWIHPLKALEASSKKGPQRALPWQSRISKEPSCC